MRALCVGSAAARMEEERPAAAEELEWRRAQLLRTQLTKVADRPLVHRRSLAERGAQELNGTARLAQVARREERAVDRERLGVIRRRWLTRGGRRSS